MKKGCLVSDLSLIHIFGTIEPFFILADLLCPVGQNLDHIFHFQLAQFSGSIMEIVVLGQPAAIVIAQTVEIPIVRNFSGQEQPGVCFDGFHNHIMHAGRHIFAFQHFLTLTVDDLALRVHHVVVLQHVFADGEVAGLQLFLGVLDGAGDHLVLNGHCLLYTSRCV